MTGLMGRRLAGSVVIIVQQGASARALRWAPHAWPLPGDVFEGTAASMNMFPVIPDTETFLQCGRSMEDTT